MIKIAPEALTLLSRQAFYETSFSYVPPHLQQVASILNDPQASSNDKYVALQLLRNAEVSAKGYYPTVRIPAPQLLLPVKGNRYGPEVTTLKP
ncbi:hypothetical protein O5340_14740 [Escherichia coli]|nr:hypothetical protein [Escherichia coli]